jgi:hypothetical protein
LTAYPVWDITGTALEPWTVNEDITINNLYINLIGTQEASVTATDNSSVINTNMNWAADMSGTFVLNEVDTSISATYWRLFLSKWIVLEYERSLQSWYLHKSVFIYIYIFVLISFL